MAFYESNKSQVTKRFDDLPHPNNLFLATYIWIDSTGKQIRLKTRTLDYEPIRPGDLPWWDSINADIFLEPVRVFNDPFYPNGKNKLVLCETYKYDKTITDENKRHKCVDTVKRAQLSKPLFIIEQKYKLYDSNGLPLGQKIIEDYERANSNTDSLNQLIEKEPRKQTKPSSQFYCSTGASFTFGRDVAEAHCKACVFSGVNIKSFNSESSLAQWKFEIGPLDGVEAGDHLWIARYILHRVAEEFGVTVKYENYIIRNKFNNFTNNTTCLFSTEEMRNKNGFQFMEDSIEKLECIDKLPYNNKHLNGFKENHVNNIGEEVLLNSNKLANSNNEDKNLAKNTNYELNISNNLKGYLEIKTNNSNYEPYELIDELLNNFLLNDSS